MIFFNEIKKSLGTKWLLPLASVLIVLAVIIPTHQTKAQFDGALQGLSDTNAAQNSSQAAADTQQAQSYASQATTAQQEAIAAQNAGNTASAQAYTAQAAADAAAAAADAKEATDLSQSAGTSAAMAGQSQLANDQSAAAQANAAAASAATAAAATATTQAAAATGNTTLANQEAATAAAASGASTASAAGSSAAAAAAAAPSCSGTSVFTNFGTCILGTIAYFIFQICATILGFVGLLFNWVVTVTVFQFATYFANSAGFLTAWGILRDVGNIMLLFGFIFMGIATILDIQNFSAKKTLPALLIFAVLLNFSLFASEAIVDVANALTSTFYTQAGSNEGTSGCATGSVSSATTCTGTAVGISGNILVASGLSTIWTPSSQNTFNAYQKNGGLSLLLLSVFVIVAAVVLLAGAIMLFVRAIILVFLLIVSPLGFAGMALPPFQSMSSSWLKKLISEAFFAPVFLLLILVSLKIMSSISTSGSTTFADAVAAPGSSNIGIFFIFCLVIGFMLASLMAAKSMGASGADRAISFSQKAIGYVPAMAGRGVAAGGRFGVGLVSSRVAKSYDSGIGKLKSSQYKFVRGVGKTFDATVGEGIVNLTNKGTSAKFGLSRSFEEDQKHRTERYRETVHSAEISALRKEVADGLKKPGEEGRDEVERALQKMDGSTIENLLKGTKDATQKQILSAAISSSKAKDLMKSKEFSANDKERFMHDRFSKASDSLAKVSEALEKFRTAPITPESAAAFREVFDENKIKVTNSDLELMANNYPELLNRMMDIYDDPSRGGNGEGIISSKQLDYLKDNESLTTSQRKAARDRTLPEQLNAAVKNADAVAIKNLMSNIGKEIGDAAVDTIKDARVIEHSNAQMWAAIMSKNEMKNRAHRTDYVKTIKDKGPNDQLYKDFKAYLGKGGSNALWWGAGDPKDKNQWPSS